MRSSIAAASWYDDVVRDRRPPTAGRRTGRRGADIGPAALAARHGVRADVARQVGAAVAQALETATLTLATSVTIASGKRVELGGDHVGRDVGRNRTRR